MTPIYSRGNVSQKCKESEKMAGATTAACGLVQLLFGADKRAHASWVALVVFLSSSFLTWISAMQPFAAQT
jgi:hypothetical protein